MSGLFRLELELGFVFVAKGRRGYMSLPCLTFLIGGFGKCPTKGVYTWRVPPMSERKVGEGHAAVY